jgi:hypothetical protein
MQVFYMVVSVLHRVLSELLDFAVQHSDDSGSEIFQSNIMSDHDLKKINKRL